MGYLLALWCAAACALGVGEEEPPPSLADRLGREAQSNIAGGAATGELSRTGEPELRGVLVLRNGEVFAGQIHREEHAYVVTLPTARIRVPEKEVDFCCRSLADAYECKRAVADPQSAEARLALAEWCLRHALLEPAEQELNAARQLDPRAPRLQLVERKLELARTRIPSRRSRQPPPRPSQDLDRLLSGLPPQSIEVFTQRIQPLLLNRCGTAGCHGPQSGAHFKLLRRGPDKPASRRVTQRNLLALSEWIDWSEWQHSPLLEHAANCHGGAKTAPLAGMQSKQYRELAEWVRQLAGGMAPHASSATSTPREEPAAAISDQPPAPPDGEATDLLDLDAASPDSDK